MIIFYNIGISIKRYNKPCFVVLYMLFVLQANSQNLFVGISKRKITPSDPVYLTGYAGREKPASGVLHDLWAKAIVLQQSPNQTIIIVTTDLLGLSHDVSESVSKVILKKYHCDRSQLVFNSSHTHSGPMIWPALSVIADYTSEQQKVVSAYTQKLINDLIEVIDEAYGTMQPMKMFYGIDSVDFAKNRRLPTEKGIINSLNINGPTDHEVPVVKLMTEDGITKAILFGYACHNTTVVGDNYLVNGDYAGFAQLDLEKRYPGSTAMFIMGCAGDQNPYPRGTIELATQHGLSLSNTVSRVVDGKMKSLDPQLKSSSKIVMLPFKAVDVEVYKKDIIGNNKFLQRRAALMLQAYDKGWKLDAYPYMVQGIRLAKGFTILSLAGEVVVDYALRAKKEYPKEHLIMSGYSNEVLCYIPSKRVLKEGGYEAVDNMIYYGMPGPFDESIEERIFSAIKTVMSEVTGK